MAKFVSKIILFTLSACPTGRSMGTVLKEVVENYLNIIFDTVYVDIDVKTTNNYRIKENPTTLFLDRTDNELYRLEGFKETEQVKQIIDEIDENKKNFSASIDENQEITEHYTIYLYKDEIPSPVKVKYRNQTSVKAPRIIAVQLLMKTNIEGYDNPFSPESKLELIEFKGNSATVTVQFNDVYSMLVKKMELLLLRTLSLFGIKQVTLQISREKIDE